MKVNTSLKIYIKETISLFDSKREINENASFNTKMVKVTEVISSESNQIKTFQEFPEESKFNLFCLNIARNYETLQIVSEQKKKKQTLMKDQRKTSKTLLP